MKLLSLLSLILVIFSCTDVQEKLNDGKLQEEKKNIENAINNVIGWAVNKDFELLLTTELSSVLKMF